MLFFKDVVNLLTFKFNEIQLLTDPNSFFVHLHVIYTCENYARLHKIVALMGYDCQMNLDAQVRQRRVFGCKKVITDENMSVGLKKGIIKIAIQC